MRQRPRGRLTLPFVKASPEAQLRLLELADLDTELGRLDHRRRTLPENAELGQLAERAAKVRDAITIADTDLADLDRELARAERDVEQVRVRIDRDNQRLDAGQVSNARELESLQSEVASLRRRQGDLEEVVLELMERREAAQALRDGAAAEARDGRRPRRRDGDRPPRRRPGRDRRSRRPRPPPPAPRWSPACPPTCSPCTTRSAPASAAAAAASCAAASAAAAGRCCPRSELNEIRAAAPDEVVRHEECRRILVRTADSGL